MASELILGSASARRAKLLAGLGVPFTVLVPAVEEVCEAGDPRGSATANARRKHAWCRQRRPAARILTADTVIDFEGRCVGKPADLAEAHVFFRLFSGRCQRVLTAVVLSRPGREPHDEVVESSVRFRRLTPADAAAYFALVDPLDKAGAYDIDQHGLRIVESYAGSRTNIMGLPVETVRRWLRDNPD